MKPSLKQTLLSDAWAGFFVFLIALPLCLGIASASGFPPIAGIFTAVIGGIIPLFFSNSELTIKGPAAGLIAIVAGAVQEFTEIYGNNSNDPMLAYKLTLGIGVAAGVLQIFFGLIKAGKFSDFFPKAAVHGMLAAIGIIIFSKQIHVLFGVTPISKTPFALLGEIPATIMHWNPEVFCIGALSLALLFGLPMLPEKVRKVLPAPMIVLILGITLGFVFDLEHEHMYLFLDSHEYMLGPKFLVTIPDNILKGLTFPDFSAVFTLIGAKWILLFSMIGTLESLISAKAVDMLDPEKRKTNLDGDMLGVGIANTATALIGGLPMISEILRSKANIDNGAKSRFANFFHGMFLLLFVALVPWLIHSIPLASLAALLVYTGYRLASPGEFIKTYKIGPEQILVFATTTIAVLATDLLIGISIGMLVKVFIHLWNGAKLKHLFQPDLTIDVVDADHVVLKVQGAMIFTNWLSFKGSLRKVTSYKEIRIDLGRSNLIDHTVMESLEELIHEPHGKNGRIEVTGLDELKPVSKHPHAARKSMVMTSPFHKPKI
jgi:MFS superfamily sulfate permease-like transporter